jgi:hypothetical protein
MTRRRVIPAGVAGLLLLVASANVQGYLIFGGATKWKQFPVRYFITDRAAPGVTANELRTAVDAAFASWSSVPTARLTTEFVGFTDTDAGEEDDATVIGFRSRPDLDRVLGQTSFKTDNNQLVESDIFLNTTFAWSVAAGGETGRFDVQSIATHEVGHLLGLGHSALGETTLVAGGRRVLGKRAVMFPIAYPGGNIDDRSLEADDIAGISGVYPTNAFMTQLGAISGRVLRNGSGIFGAHVVALNQGTGEMVGAFSLDAQGRFSIAGLPPGIYLVRVEPLDDADITSFFNSNADVNLDFKPTYFPRLVPVPAGGSSGNIEITVEAK